MPDLPPLIQRKFYKTILNTFTGKQFAACLCRIPQGIHLVTLHRLLI
ncbi:MAG: hypothetical protein LBP19_08640 [Treponema sp.]|nr:hypothetical protein [Treponema sp.]